MFVSTCKVAWRSAISLRNTRMSPEVLSKPSCKGPNQSTILFYFLLEISVARPNALSSGVKSCHLRIFSQAVSPPHPPVFHSHNRPLPAFLLKGYCKLSHRNPAIIPISLRSLRLRNIPDERFSKPLYKPASLNFADKLLKSITCWR